MTLDEKLPELFKDNPRMCVENMLDLNKPKIVYLPPIKI